MRKTINLFIDAHTFDNEFQGSRTYIKEIYNRFTENQDIQFHFAANDIENLKKEIIPRSNIHYLQYRGHSSIKRLMLELPVMLKKANIDYAHFQYIAPPVKVCKYVITTHDVIFHDFPGEFSWFYRLQKHLLYKISALRADVLTTVSEFSKKSIAKFFKIPASNIHVIHNAVSEKYFEDHNKTFYKDYIKNKYNIENFVLVVSRIEPRKNHIALIKAFKKLGLFEKGYQLVFIGTKSILDSKLDAELDSIAQYKNKGYYHLENIPEDDLVKFYCSSKVSVYPSKGEGFGIPPLESGAAKVPTLCSNVSAMSDFDFFEEFHYDPADQQGFEKKLLDMLENDVPENRLEEIKNAIKNKYSWHISANQLSELILSDAH